MARTKALLLSSIIACLAFTTATTHAENMTGGAMISSHGIGFYLSGDTKWHLTSQKNDTIRWRTMAGTISGHFEDNDIYDIDLYNGYEGDIDFSGLQLGFDWYPFSSSQFFISSGAAYLDRQLTLNSQDNADFKIGDIDISANDGVNVNSTSELSSLAPYISIGWGNRHKGESGLSFYGEIGIISPLSNAEANATISGNTDIVSDAAINQYIDDLENDIGATQGMLTIGLGYHF